MENSQKSQKALVVAATDALREAKLAAQNSVFRLSEAQTALEKARFESNSKETPVQEHRAVKRRQAQEEGILVDSNSISIAGVSITPHHGNVLLSINDQSVELDSDDSATLCSAIVTVDLLAKLGY